MLKKLYSRFTEYFWIRVFLDAARGWFADKASQLGASVAFFSIFSLAPLLLLLTATLELFFGEEGGKVELQRGIAQVVSPEAAVAIAEIAVPETGEESTLLAAILGVCTVLLGATGVFGQLQDALNTIWRVRAKPEKSWLHFLRKRFLSFGMILVIGFLLLLSLSLSTAIEVLEEYVTSMWGISSGIVTSANYVISFSVISLLFAFLFRVLPDAEVTWKQVGVGAVLTAILFTVGQSGLAWYLGREGTTSSYGSAGAFILVLFWIYYSSLILFFGAEFTRAYAEQSGDGISPSPNAVRVRRGSP